MPDLPTPPDRVPEPQGQGTLHSLPTAALDPLSEAPPAGNGSLVRIAPELEQALDRPDGATVPGDRYRRIALVGEGGTGAVYSVEDRLLQRTIAVKRLQQYHSTDLGRLFLQEARLCASLDHPCVIPVHDYGVDSQDRPYIAMKLVQGETLTQNLRRLGAIRDGQRAGDLLDVFSRVCEAMAFSHSKGWLHADLKPSNIMMGAFGEVYVVDWGNAIPSRRWNRPLNYVAGTPSFMSPEQARGGCVGPPSDVYGIGGCLYLALTRRTPYPGTPDEKVARAAAGEPIVLPPSAARAPEPLLRLALRCLSPEVADRPADVLQLKRELDRIRSGTWGLPQVSLDMGQDVVREGEAGDTAYLVLSGAVEVLQAGKGCIATLSVGDVFGELAPILGKPRTSTVRTLEPTTLAVMSGEELRESLAMGRLGGRFVKAIADRMLQREREG